MWWLISCNQWMTVEQLQIHFSGLYGIQPAQDHQELKSWQIAFVNKNHMNILICNDCCHPCWYDSWVVKQHQIIVFLFCWILFSEQLHIVCVHGKQWHFDGLLFTCTTPKRLWKQINDHENVWQEIELSPRSPVWTLIVVCRKHPMSSLSFSKESATIACRHSVFLLCIWRTRQWDSTPTERIDTMSINN